MIIDGSENLEVAGVDAAVIGGAGDGVGGRCQVDVHHGIRGINVAVMKLSGGLVLDLYGKKTDGFAKYECHCLGLPVVHDLYCFARGCFRP